MRIRLEGLRRWSWRKVGLCAVGRVDSWVQFRAGFDKKVGWLG